MQSVGQSITEQVFGKIQLHIGMQTQHPDGRNVVITKGQAWSNGRLSNFWYWKEIKQDGSFGPEEHGYGWI
jgi:hypothetical protein